MKITERLFRKSKYNKYLIGAAVVALVAIPSSVVAFSSKNDTAENKELSSMVSVEHAVDTETTTANDVTNINETTETSVVEINTEKSQIAIFLEKSSNISSNFIANEINDKNIDNIAQTAKKEIEAINEEKERKRLEEEALALAEAQQAQQSEPVQEQVTYTWDGAVLSPQAGVVYGPSGKETYYNLDMSGVISIMRGMGFDEASYPYWVRSDGCKMLGDYIMVAADLNTRPRGSTIECSLGTALVCDTGGFAYSNPTQLDIAVTW